MTAPRLTALYQLDCVTMEAVISGDEMMSARISADGADLFWRQLAVRAKAAVVRLFQTCRPAAISRLIIAVVVDALDGVQRCWAQSHIIKEARENAPPLTDGYAASTIVSVTGAFGIGRALNHRVPNAIFRYPDSGHASLLKTFGQVASGCFSIRSLRHYSMVSPC